MSEIAKTKHEPLAQGVFAAMAPEFPNVSAPDLFATRGLNTLSATIADMKTAEKTERFLSLGAHVRRDHSAGHSNSSFSSTVKGALSVAEGILNDIPLPESRGERLFGENIRETYYFFRRLKRMFSK